MKDIRGTATFWGAILAQLLVLIIYWQSNLAWLWLNVAGALMVIIFARLLHPVLKENKKG
jgi:hypothetical protein